MPAAVGAVYVIVEPVPEMVPPVAVQVTLVSVAPVTVAVNVWLLPPSMVLFEGDRAIVTTCLVTGAVTVIVEDPDAPEAAGSAETATTVHVVVMAGAT